MAWGNVDVEEQRMRFVIAASRREKPFRHLCAEFDISRPTGYEWWKRYQAGWPQGGARKKPAAASQPGAHGRRHRSPGGATAATVSRLGSTQTACGVAAGRN